MVIKNKLTRAEKRGAYTKERRKKFQYLKNVTGKLNEYYLQKRASKQPKKKVEALKPRPVEIRFSFWLWIKKVFRLRGLAKLTKI